MQTAVKIDQAEDWSLEVEKLPDLQLLLMDELGMFRETWDLPADCCEARL